MDCAALAPFCVEAPSSFIEVIGLAVDGDDFRVLREAIDTDDHSDGVGVEAIH